MCIPVNCSFTYVPPVLINVTQVSSCTIKNRMTNTVSTNTTVSN